MKMRNVCLCVAVLSAPVAQASIQLDNISCSGSLSLNDRNGVSFDCGGDLSLSGGTVSAETGDLLIKAGGTLSLENVLLIASNITLSGNAVYIADDVIFDITANDSQVSIRPSINILEGGRIELTPAPSLAILPGQGAGISTTDINWEAYIVPPQSVNFIQRQYGGGITIFPPQGEVKLRESGITGLNIQVVNPVFIQGTPVTVPIPAALAQWLLGLCTLLAPALMRKKRVD